MYIKGVVKKDRKTKKLTNRLEYGDIALIDHKDLDEVAALSLVEKKVKCVVNINETISGRYPNQGPLSWLKPIFLYSNLMMTYLIE